MRQTIGFMAACAALLASCTNEMNEGLGIDTPIQVTANVEGIITTRAGNTTESLTEFGLSIKDGQSYDGDYAGENILAKSENGTWTLDKTVLYKGGGQTYFAYAPYNADMAKGATTYAFSVQADQSAEGAMQASDLLYAAGTVRSAKLDITLAHKLSKLTVTVTKKGGTSPIEVGDVTLRGTVPTATLDLTSDDAVVASGTETDITMCPTGSTGIYECILVPREEEAKFGVSFTYGGDTYLWESSYTFKGGNAYTLALTFDGKVSAGEVTVSEWGKPIEIEGGEAVESYTIEADGSYTVYTAEGLLAWAEVADNNGINCTLAADIDMTNREWESISYSGTFDGNGHTITGLGDCLLKQNHTNGTVRNLILAGPTILAEPTAGAVAAENWGTIENCHVVGGSVKGTGYGCGGIAGNNSLAGSILACSSSAAVSSNNAYVGGIVGINNSDKLIACYATGSVTGDGSSVGAIAGQNDINNGNGTITACFWSMDNIENGVGENQGIAEVEKVEGGVTWENAMATMNAALAHAQITYRWIENTGEDKEDRPLIITNE